MVIFEYLENYNIFFALAIAALAFLANIISRGKALAYHECDQSTAIFCGVLIYMIPAALSTILIAMFAMRLLVLPILIWATFYEGSTTREVIEMSLAYGKGFLSAGIVIFGNLLSFRFGRRLAK